jgi:serine/threonine protein kinase
MISSVGTAVGQRPEALRLGSYEILRQLARGGMAELFLARTVGPESFEKLVVLKKILPKFADNPKFVRLFLDEARLAAALDHPHIAHVYDLGKVETSYFFTMEYVHGQDLHATVKRIARLGKRLPIGHAVQLAHAVASALHYAHERRASDGSLLGIVHRDVSPSNVLIAYDGAIKLVDFGVAKAATSTVKTRTGTLKGKIAYMSPEQAKGSPIDRRSDVFALGTVLWEMVTSHRLFKAENDLASIQRIINSEAQPPIELREDCPPELETIILKALAVDVNERYQTAEELQLDLEELAREHKLVQSTVALRAYMSELFGEEIAAWRAAQASGVTLTEHVALAPSTPGTPASDGDAYAMDEYELDELDEIDDTGGHAPLLPAVQGAFEVPQPPIPDTTPYLRHQGAVVVAGGRAATQTSPSQVAYTDPNAFPIAPREWRSASPKARLEDRRIKQLVLGALGVLAILALLALAFGGSEPVPVAPATTPTVEESSPVIEMTPSAPTKK